MIKGNLGLKYIAALCESGDLDILLSDGFMERLFLEHELPAYEYVRAHAAEHGALPQPTTVEQHTGDSLPVIDEPASYYLKHLHARFVDRGLREAIEDANLHLKPGPQKDPLAALSSLAESLHGLQLAESRDTLVDFRDSLVPVMSEYQQAYSGEGTGLLLGWPSFDEMSGGIQGGELASFVGRPGKGKTWKLCYSAEYAWRTGKVPLLVTMEMKAQRIVQRLAALHAHIPGMQLKLGQLGDKNRGKLAKALKKAKTVDHPFWVLDGGLGLTVDRLRMITQQVRPDVLFVDGAYMLEIEDTRANRWTKIMEACRALKMLALELNIPVVASWQFRRDNSKKKTEEDAPKTLDDVYGSDAIAQYSALVMGLFQAETVETIHRKLVQVLKDREGPGGEFYVRWDFQNMDFSEVDPADVASSKDELEYV